MRIQHLFAALALTAVTATPALAQAGQEVAPAAPMMVTSPGQWGVTPFLSLTFGGNGDSTSLGLGGALSYAFTDRLEFEGELAYVIDLIGDDEVEDWSVLGASGNALYNFPLANAGTAMRPPA